jgi:hypothetical protein
VHDKEGALLLLEHPLKCHLLLAQIDAGMWRRNGEHTMSGYVQELVLFSRTLLGPAN